MSLDCTPTITLPRRAPYTVVAMSDDYLDQTYHQITPQEWELHQHGGLWYPQCTVLTRKDTWCKNPIFHGQIYTYWGEDNIPVVRLEDWAVIEAGMCTVHAKLAERP